MVKYSPTGNHVYSASEDKTIKMWDVSTGIDVNTFNAHESGVVTIELSKDGNTLISGDQSGVIIIWDALTGEVKQRIEAHDGAVLTARLSKDGQMIASGGEDKILKLWNFNGDTIKTITGFTAPITNLAISPSGDRIVTGGGKNNGVEVKLVDPEKGEILADALDNVKGSGAAMAYTKVIMTGFAVVGNIAGGRVGKGMTTIFVMAYSNIEFTDDGQKILFSQNLYTPFIAEKGKEEETGGASASIVELSADRNNFGEVSRPNRWAIPHPRGVALFNKDQTKVIVNEARSIKVYDIENAEFPEPGKKEAVQYVPPVVKEIENIPMNTNWLALSPDYRTIVTSDDNRQLKLWDYESGRKIRDMQGYVQPALAIDAMPDGKHIIVGSQDRNMTMWDITTGQLVRTFDRSSDVNSIDISSDGKYMATTATNTKFLKVWNFRSGRLLRSLMEKKDNIVWVKFNPEDEDKIWAQTDKNDVREWSIKEFKISGKVKQGPEELEDKFSMGEYKIRFQDYDLSIENNGTSLFSDTQLGIVTDAVFSKDGKYVISTNEAGEITMYNLKTKKKTVSMALIGEGEFITYTPDYYYTSSKGAAKAFAFKSANKVLPFEQFELKFNRPDIIANALGYASDKLINSYKAAYDKRLKRLGFTEANLVSNFNLPEVEVDVMSLPLETSEQELNFLVKASDDGGPIMRLMVYVNDVPVFGSKGLDVSDQNANTLEQNISLKLSAGLNEIKVSAMNQKGQESIAETFEIQYTAEYDKPDLYLVSIGISEYQQSSYNLAFAAKDATDIVDLLSSSSAYENVNVKLITNSDATDTRIKDLRSFVEQAKVDDVVMIFIAGHGVLDDAYNYYFATHNIDFNNPSTGGLPYEELEKIIDGIDCRNKILMMDTCHSGELDEEDVVVAEEQTKKVGSVSFRSTGTVVKLKENNFGLSNTLELSKSLFGDLKKGTGATVISAAGGTEFAAEGINSTNGLFTGSFIEGLKTRRADRNRDRTYSISEIRKYISEQVIARSGGNQVPTSREENIKNDFRIY
jgi:WD40 repeat protein